MLPYLLLIISYVIIQPIAVQAQLSCVGTGWAGNSINAVIFRKNSVVIANGIQYTAWYDSSGTVLLAKRPFDSENWESIRTPLKGNIFDAHCSISIMIDGEGYLHIVWNQHDNSLHYCRSLSPDSLIFSNEIPMTGMQENSVSYPEFYKLPGGDLIFMYRDGSSGNGSLILNRYYVSARQWQRIQTNLIDGEDERNAYWQACVDNEGTIHLSWVWRETWDVSTNHDLCYAKSADGGNTWQKSNGDSYSLPITAATAEIIYNIPQKSELINQTSMTVDSRERPYIAGYWRLNNSEIPQYRLVFQRNSKWRMVQISQKRIPFSLSGGGTKNIPVSRPQVLVTGKNNSLKVLILFRDEELGNRVSCFINSNNALTSWEAIHLTDFSVGNWEPTYDTESWMNDRELYLFIQHVAQGDAEKTVDLPSQPVYILHVSEEEFQK